MDLSFHCGAIERNTRKAAVGGVARDVAGNWILGFNHFLGTCSPFVAELWGILVGLLIMLGRGYKRGIIHTDNLEVAKALNENVRDDLGIKVLRRVQTLLLLEGQWRICYIAREDNAVADRFAKLDLSWKSSLQILNIRPTEVLRILQRNLDHDNALLS